jgi:nitric oxide reductase large subunit
MVFLSALCIGGFYATSLTWGQQTHYAMIEYWRWWLVHLWVEGFFEVFATAVIALLFTRLGLIRAATANSAIILETIVFLFGGILGTLHHLYFTGTPTSVIAIGAMFSALEVVPLAMIGVEAWRNYQRSKAPWVQAYKWPILCFIAVGFWNVVGAGLLGFTINTPIALYYMQGLNMTAAHGHAALFGVYGMLGIGLLLFCLRGLSNRGVVRQVARPDFLVAQYRSGDDGLHVARAGRCLPGVGQHQRGCMVCTFAGFRTFVVDGNLRLVARPGRHRFCSRYAVSGALRWALADRPA